MSLGVGKEWIGLEQYISELQCMERQCLTDQIQILILPLPTVKPWVGIQPIKTCKKETLGGAQALAFLNTAQMMQRTVSVENAWFKLSPRMKTS